MREFAANKIPKPNLSFEPCGASHRGPIDLEIGAGQGLHAIRYAQLHPDRTLLAAEKTHTRYRLLEARHARHKELSNLKILHVDAVALVTHFIGLESLSRVFLLYPNPYPKAKQANLRWHNRPFFDFLLTRLKPGGEVTLATNLKWYADEAAEKLVENGRLILLQRVELNSATIRQPRTHFEKKYLARGESCWNLILRKPGESSSIDP